MHWMGHFLPSTKRQFKRLANLLAVAAMLGGTQGIQRRDVITAINGKPVTDVGKESEQISGSEGTTVRLVLPARVRD